MVGKLDLEPSGGLNKPCELLGCDRLAAIAADYGLDPRNDGDFQLPTK